MAGGGDYHRQGRGAVAGIAALAEFPAIAADDPGPGLSARRQYRRGSGAAAAQAGMTPFGAKLRELRAARGILLRDMAAALEVSAPYLSALEHGRRAEEH